jgi:hypothetical protein
MEIPTAIIVDLERLLSMLDARAGRQNVVYLELERAKRAVERGGLAQHRPLSDHDREKQTEPDGKE